MPEGRRDDRRDDRRDEPPDERTDVAALIERLVRESNLPDPRAREDLRRELRSHFEEAASSPEAARNALDRFGAADVVARAFRRAYRRGRLALYAAKVLASIVAASGAALAVQLVANVRIGVEGGGAAIRLGAGYVISVWFSIAIVVVLVAAWELDIEPLCARVERRPLRLVATFAALFASIYLGYPAVHGPAYGPMDVALIVAASGAALAVWACTVAIVARLDLAFVNLLGPREE